jgi:hypothetical protein
MFAKKANDDNILIEAFVVRESSYVGKCHKIRQMHSTRRNGLLLRHISGPIPRDRLKKSNSGLAEVPPLGDSSGSKSSRLFTFE